MKWSMTRVVWLVASSVELGWRISQKRRSNETEVRNAGAIQSLADAERELAKRGISTKELLSFMDFMNCLCSLNQAECCDFLPIVLPTTRGGEVGVQSTFDLNTTSQPSVECIDMRVQIPSLRVIEKIPPEDLLDFRETNKAKQYFSCLLDWRVSAKTDDKAADTLRDAIEVHAEELVLLAEKRHLRGRSILHVQMTDDEHRWHRRTVAGILNFAGCIPIVSFLACSVQQKLLAIQIDAEEQSRRMKKERRRFTVRHSN